MVELTKRQREIVEFVESFYSANRVGPTRREIMEHFGFASTQAVTCHLDALINKDAIVVYEKTSRGILPKERTLKVKCPCCGEKFNHKFK